MKRFLVLLFSIFICSIAHADTETINWYKDGTLYNQTTCESGTNVNLPTTPTKRGYTFLGWRNNNTDFTSVEYLESTGTQCINTGVSPNQNTRVKIMYDVSSVGSIFCAGYQTNIDACDLGFFSTESSCKISSSGTGGGDAAILIKYKGVSNNVHYTTAYNWLNFAEGKISLCYSCQESFKWTLKLNTTAIIDNVTHESGDTISWTYDQKVPFQNISFLDSTYNDVFFYNKTSFVAHVTTNSNKRIVDMNKNVFYLYDENNNLLFNTSATPETFQSSYLYLFARSGNITNTQNVKIYYAQIYDNDVLIRYLIPANKDANPCMYDFVSGNFFYNSCSGTFNIGQSIE